MKWGLTNVPEPSGLDMSQWYPVRKYKFSIQHPINRDVMVLSFVKYEYEERYLTGTSGELHEVRNAKSFIFARDGWVEMAPGVSLEEWDLPTIDGLDIHKAEQTRATMALVTKSVMRELAKIQEGVREKDDAQV